MHESAGSNPARPTRVKAIHILVDMAQTGVPVSRRLSPPERESDMLLRPDGGAVERPASRERRPPPVGLKSSAALFASGFAVQTDIQREQRPTVIGIPLR